MVPLTRITGAQFALNPDLIERVDRTPDTIITLVDGKKYVVAESLPEVIALIRQFRASVVADAQHIAAKPPSRRHEAVNDSDEQPTNVVQLHPRER